MADNFNFVQAQPFSLAGAGCIMGATSITLNSMLQIDGVTPLTMAAFGTKGFATIEPGNGTREEQISFSGITQNANGTATLTGVHTVAFITPYTETSGTSLSHPGGVKLIITNTAGFYNELTSVNDDETINGDWTFTNFAPTIPTQLSTDVHRAASIEYVNAVVVSGAPNAATNVKGIVQLATQAQADARTATGSTGAALVATPDLARSTLLSDYKADTGSANAYVITPVPAITAYAAGQGFSFKAANSNTTVSTLNVNALGTKTIKKLSGAVDLVAGDIVSGQIVQVEYDGTNFQLVSPVGTNVLPSISSGNINEFLGTTDGSTFSFGRPFDYQVFTSSGTWTKPTNLSGNEMVLVQAWGQGGGGGGGDSSTNGAGGGGGGAFVQANFLASQLGSTVTVTVGNNTNGGAGSTAGTVGANTTFGSLLTSYGGGGGARGSQSAGGGGGGSLSAGTSVTASTGGAGGSPGGSTVSTDNSGFGGGGGGSTGSGGNSAYGGGGGGGVTTGGGQPGGSSIYGGAGGGAGGSSIGGAAGTSQFGGAGGAGGTGAAGSAGVQPSGGGGGGANSGNAGGKGGAGMVRVWTFY